MTELTARTRRQPRPGLLPVVCLTVALVGCGGGNAGPRRVAVEGVVTFDGLPLEKGSILFVPTGGTVGPEAGGVIEGGRYRLSRVQGPVIGNLRVEIRAHPQLGFDPTEPEQTVQHIGQPWPKNGIPAIYNDRSTLVVQTTADGDGKFDFPLHSKPQNRP